jgi:hypothetical protein
LNDQSELYDIDRYACRIETDRLIALDAVWGHTETFPATLERLYDPLERLNYPSDDPSPDRLAGILDLIAYPILILPRRSGTVLDQRG